MKLISGYFFILPFLLFSFYSPVRSDESIFLIAAFVTVTFTWSLYFYSPFEPTFGISPFSLSTYDMNGTANPDDAVIVDQLWDIARTYPSSPLPDFRLSGSGANVTSTLYSDNLAHINPPPGPFVGPNPFYNASWWNISHVPTADAVILRGVSCLLTEFWNTEWNGENMTCGIWAAQTIAMSPDFDVAFQICLGPSTFQGEPYLLAGSRSAIV
jgi:hypothetical protein